MAHDGHTCVVIPLTDSIISPDASSPLTHSPTHRQLAIPCKRSVAANVHATEREPLLDASTSRNRRKREDKKPFYRPRPLWLVPFALLSSLARGMTVAPRIDVYTQLACDESEFKHSSRPHALIPIPISLSNGTITSAPSAFASTPAYTYIHEQSYNARSCSTSPPAAIQARAARLQTTMTTTVGLLSAFTTAWWGQFGERHGRMSVLAIASVGLLITDLTFLLISLSSSSTPLSAPHHNILLAQTLEGVLGGWPSLQSATMAYIADCTQSSASLVRFTGVVYVGLALGPVVGAALMRHAHLFEFFELWSPSFQDRFRVLFDAGAVVTPVFGAAILCSLVNILLVVFVFPESLPKEKRQAPFPPPTVPITATVASSSTDEQTSFPLSHSNTPKDLEEPRASSNFLKTILSPLAVFLPQDVYLGTGMRRDWSLTALGVVVFGYMISAGILQMKYMYAKHTYSWGAEQLSYYISWLGGLRAVHLLVILPYIITTFKPKLKPKFKTKINPALIAPPIPKSLKPKPTKARLAQQIDFDLGLTRLSVLMDILSHVFVVLSPSPGSVHALGESGGSSEGEVGGGRNHIAVEMFVAASSLGSFGAGAFPAVQSLALSIMQLRALHNSSASNNNNNNSNNEPEDPITPSNIGALFGALAVLQTLGQSILGPLLFGLVYSSTVGTYPKAIFVGAAGVGVVALALLFLVRPVGVGTGLGGKAKAMTKARRMMLARDMLEGGEVERGRSRVSKDLRGGAVAWNGTRDGRVGGGSGSGSAAAELVLELA